MSGYLQILFISCTYIKEHSIIYNKYEWKKKMKLYQ